LPFFFIIFFLQIFMNFRNHKSYTNFHKNVQQIKTDSYQIYCIKKLLECIIILPFRDIRSMDEFTDDTYQYKNKWQKGEENINKSNNQPIFNKVCFSLLDSTIQNLQWIYTLKLDKLKKLTIGTICEVNPIDYNQNHLMNWYKIAMQYNSVSLLQNNLECQNDEWLLTVDSKKSETLETNDRTNRTYGCDKCWPNQANNTWYKGYYLNTFSHDANCSTYSSKLNQATLTLCIYKQPHMY